MKDTLFLDEFDDFTQIASENKNLEEVKVEKVNKAINQHAIEFKEISFDKHVLKIPIKYLLGSNLNFEENKK